MKRVDLGHNGYGLDDCSGVLIMIEMSCKYQDTRGAKNKGRGVWIRVRVKYEG